MRIKLIDCYYPQSVSNYVSLTLCCLILIFKLREGFKLCGKYYGYAIVFGNSIEWNKHIIDRISWMKSIFPHLKMQNECN